MDGLTDDLTDDSCESYASDTSGDEGDNHWRMKEAMADAMYICCQRPKKRDEMLDEADDKLIKCICACSAEILNGNVLINDDEKDKLRCHRTLLRKLANPDFTLDEKKDAIVQNGGNFLLSLVPTIIGALSAMFN